MKKTWRWPIPRLFICALVVFAFAVHPARATEEKPAAEFAVSALSKYVWRGYESSRDSVVVQPSLTVAYKGFIANVWGNLDTKPYSQTSSVHSSTWTETDLTLSYSKTIGLLNAGVGYIYYGLGAANSGAPKPLDSQEVFVTLGLNTFLAPILTAYKEIDHYHQYYFLLGVSHTFTLTPAVSLKLGASASYLLSDYADAALFNMSPSYGGYPEFNDNSRPTDKTFHNLHDGLVTASLPIKLMKYITAAPTVSCSFPLSGDAQNEIKGRGKKANPADNNSVFAYGGITLMMSF